MVRRWYRVKSLLTPAILIICVVLPFYSCSTNESSTPSPSTSSSLDTIKFLTLGKVDEISITINWELLKTDGVVDYTIVYTVYVEPPDEEGIFTKNSDTKTVYTVTPIKPGETESLEDDTGSRTTVITVANLTNDTPYRIVVEAKNTSGSSRSEIIAYTASRLSNSDISGVEIASPLDSGKATVTWDPQEGAQAYLIQASDEKQIENEVLADNVLAVVCPPVSLLCEREDQFAQEKDGKLQYVLRVNEKGKYHLVVVPFNFQDLSGFQVTDGEGRLTFTEGVLSRLKDENSALAKRLKASKENDRFHEFHIKVRTAGPPRDLVLSSTGNTLLASWGHGVGAEYYYAILSNEVNLVTNLVDRYGSSGRFIKGGYTGFSNLTANTLYRVTVHSLTVVSNTTNMGGGVSNTLATKDAPEAVINFAVALVGNQAVVTWEEATNGSPAIGYLLEYLPEVTTPITHVDTAGDGLSGLSWEGAISIEVPTNSTGNYSNVVDGLDVTSATNVFRVKGVRVDDLGASWGSAYRYYALGADPSRAPSTVGKLIFSEHRSVSFKVTWTRPEDPGRDRNEEQADLVGYQVSWGATPEKLGNSNEIAEPDTLSYSITGLTSGTKYYVKVEAKNDNSEGYIYNAGTNGSTYTIKPPGEVVGITYSEHTTNGFKVSWDEVTDAGYHSEGPLTSVGYRMELSSNQGNVWSPAVRSNYLATEETFSNLISGTDYRVRIIATNRISRSGSIVEGGETWTLSLPDRVDGLMLSDPTYDGTNHQGGFTVTWTSPSDTGVFSNGDAATITGYQVSYAEVGVTGKYIPVPHEGTMTEHVFTDLTPNTEYDIRIQARTAVGDGIGGHVFGWVPSPPEPVDPDSILFSLPTASTIRIEWTAPRPGKAGGASADNIPTLYQVEIAADGSDHYNLVQDDYAGTIIIATNLSKSTTYHARVTAKNTWGKMSSTSTNTGTTTATDADPPSPVENLKVDSNTHDQMVLSWNVPTNPGTDGTTTATLSGYIVKYKKTADDGFIEINERSVGVRLSQALAGTNATVIGLSASTSYTFLVVAINSGNAVGIDLDAPTIQQNTTPVLPGNLRQTRCEKSTSVVLAWDPSLGATSYKIYRGDKEVATNITATSYTDTGLTPGNEYTYKVQACKDDACSDDSDPRSITTLSDKVFESIIDLEKIPKNLTSHDERSREIFSRYRGGASLVVKYLKPLGEGDGSSFDNAAGNLGTVLGKITDATADQVYALFLAGGTYQAGSTMAMKNHVAIIGGVDECLAPSETVTALDGDGAYSVFSNNGLNNTAFLYGVTITNGNAEQGGGMYNHQNSSPSLDGVTFSGNTAKYGGGIYNSSSSPSLDGVTFSGNTAAYYGGGMYNHQNSSPSLDGVTFSGNTAAYYGGGMYNHQNSSPSLDGVTFSGNTAAYYGGGMYNHQNSSPSLDGVTFSGNTAAYYGGGMYNYQNSSPSLDGVTFSGNTADYGGGMYNSSSSPSLDGVTFSGNTAKGGGGMYNDYSSPSLDGVTFSGNTATYDGGGMYNSSSSPSLDGVTFSGNTANNWGGGMYNRWGSTPSLEGVTFSGNRADEGGGMYNENNSSPTLKGVAFSRNTAKGGGGMYNDYSSPSLDGVTFSGNTATSGGGMYNAYFSSPSLDGVTFSGNSAKWSGGGMRNAYFSSPSLDGVTFSGNTAKWGGGMYIYNSSPSLDGVTFSGNSADDGGGMFNEHSSPSLVGVTFSGNTADFGGAIYNDNNNINKWPIIINGIFWGNTAVSGQQIYFQSRDTSEEKMEIFNSIVEGGMGSLARGEITTPFEQGGFAASEGYSVFIEFSDIITKDPELRELADNGGSVSAHAIPGNSEAVNQGLYVKRKATTVDDKTEYTFYYSADKSTWYTNPDLSGTAVTPPADAEDLTDTDATGYSRRGRPDLGAYEAR